MAVVASPTSWTEMEFFPERAMGISSTPGTQTMTNWPGVNLKDSERMNVRIFGVSLTILLMETVRGSLVPQLSASGSIVRLNSLIDMKLGQTYYLPVLDGSHSPTGDIVPMSSASITSDKIGNTYTGKLTASWPIS